MYGVFTRWIGDFVLIYFLEVCMDWFFHHLFQRFHASFPVELRNVWLFGAVVPSNSCFLTQDIPALHVD